MREKNKKDSDTHDTGNAREKKKVIRMCKEIKGIPWNKTWGMIKSGRIQLNDKVQIDRR